MTTEIPTGLRLASNENVYETLWSFRESIFKQIVSNNTSDIYQVFALIDAFDRNYSLAVEPVFIEDRQTGEKVKCIKSQPIVTQKPNAESNEVHFEIDQKLAVIKMALEEQTQTIVELGCGYGRKILELQTILKKYDFKYIGAEYTESGRRIAHFLSSVFYPKKQFSFPFVDHKTATFPFMPQDEHVLVYSCHSLEQINELPLDYFVKLADSTKNIKGAHIEPFGFQVPAKDQQTSDQQDHETFMKDRNYNLNMYECLKYAEKEGAIKIDSLQVDFAYSQSENPSSWVVWSKV